MNSLKLFNDSDEIKLWNQLIQLEDNENDQNNTKLFTLLYQLFESLQQFIHSLQM